MHRFVGWLLCLTGIAILVAWLVLPIDAAVRASLPLTLVLVVLSLGRKLHSLATWHGNARS